MKITPLSTEVDKMNKQSRLKSNDNGFQKLMGKLYEDNNHDNQPSEKLEIGNKPTIFYNNKLSTATGNRIAGTEINTISFKAFMGDAMNIQVEDIKQCIDDICSDETGENIDMEALRDYLELYINEIS